MKRKRNNGKRYRKQRVSRISNRSPEYKVRYETFNADDITHAFSINTNLCPLLQGDDNTQRIGRKIILTRISLRFLVTAHEDTGVYDNQQVRLMLVQNRQTGGTDLSPAELLRNSTTYALTSPLNLDYRHKYTMLFDRTLILTPVLPTRSVVVTMPLSLQVIYNAGTNDVAAISSNSLSLVAVGSANQADTYPTLSGYVTLRFMDL
jgi:hypothetical protein